MATYYIVDKDKDPLGAGEVNADSTIQVNAGDIFIVEANANDDIKFEAASGSSTDFEVRIDDSNSSNFKIEIKEDLNPDIHIADNVDVGDIEIEARDAESASFTAGNNVTLQKYKGSENGDDTLVIGSNFSAQVIRTRGGDDSITIGDGASVDEINTGKGDDTLTIGDDFTSDSIETKSGNDNVTIGDGGSVGDINTEKGDDTLVIGDDFTGDKIETKGGNDDVTIGTGADIDDLDGGGGADQLTTSTDLAGAQAFETVVCFVRGTLIRTAHGDTLIEDLSVGDLVVTLDRGLQTIRWIGSSVVRGRGALAPVHIAKGAMSNKRELFVSQQHRMLMGDWRIQLYFGENQVLVPAKFLADGKLICIEEVERVEYFHMLFDHHEIVFSEGTASESFHPGKVGLGSMSDATRDEIFKIFPSLRSDMDGFGASARPSLKAFESSLLVDSLAF